LGGLAEQFEHLHAQALILLTKLQYVAKPCKWYKVMQPLETKVPIDVAYDALDARFVTTR